MALGRDVCLFSNDATIADVVKHCAQPKSGGYRRPLQPLALQPSGVSFVAKSRRAVRPTTCVAVVGLRLVSVACFYRQRSNRRSRRSASANSASTNTMITTISAIVRPALYVLCANCSR